MNEDIDETIMVDQLRAAGSDSAKQVPALFKLGEWYLKKANASKNAADFTKAGALYNAALVRPRLENCEINEDQILGGICETYQEFLRCFAKKSVDVHEIRSEIHSHKRFLEDERRIIKERVEHIDSRFNRKHKSKDQYEVFKNHKKEDVNAIS